MLPRGKSMKTRMTPPPSSNSTFVITHGGSRLSAFVNSDSRASIVEGLLFLLQSTLPYPLTVRSSRFFRADGRTLWHFARSETKSVVKAMNRIGMHDQVQS